MRIPAVLVAATLTLAAQSALAVSNDFSTNPLTDPTVIVQGPDAANVASRFTYNAGTLTAHYDTALPTIKLLFPLGQHVNQNTSFNVSTTFKILSSGFVTPPDFGSSVPAFGLVNSTSTGNVRASTSDLSYAVITPGDAYNLMTYDYFPTQNADGWGANSVDLSVVQSPQTGQTFNDRFMFDSSLYTSQSLAFDQFMTLTIQYNAATHHASVNWGSGSLDADLTGAVFDEDAFAITLWNDPQYAPTDGSFAWDAGNSVSGDVVFDSFSVTVVPEPASLGMLGAGMALLMLRRRR